MIYVGAKWAARKETKEEAASKLAEFLRAISIFERVASWIIWTKPSIEGRTPVEEFTREWLAPYFKPHMNDVGRLIEDRGFSLVMTNGMHKPSQGISLSLSMGAFGSNSNDVSVEFGREVVCDDLGELEAILKAMICAFDPDHAVVTNHVGKVDEPWKTGVFTYERGGIVETHDGGFGVPEWANRSSPPIKV